jgi:hypothetical protein
VGPKSEGYAPLRWTCNPSLPTKQSCLGDTLPGYVCGGFFRGGERDNVSLKSRLQRHFLRPSCKKITQYSAIRDGHFSLFPALVPCKALLTHACRPYA